MTMRTDGLLPMEKHPTQELSNEVVGVYVVLEVAHGRKLLGTFMGWDDLGDEVVLSLPNGAVVREPISAIVRGWYAPMGFRP